MNRNSTITTGAICAAIIAGPAIMGRAGPLDPPVGPVAPTPGPEPRIPISAATTPGDANSLFKITQPGSYYLTGNIAGVAGKHGIEIAADGVALDLMGFALIGVAGSFDGVVISGAIRRDIAILSGAAEDWGDDGIDAQSASSIRVADLRVSGNASDGLLVGPFSAITGCVARLNGGAGIACEAACTVMGCSSNNNGADGISCTSAATIIGCEAESNGGDGISIQSGGVSGCSANFNAAAGIAALVNGVITQCSVGDNSGTGIAAGSSSIVASCVARANTLDGIMVTSSSAVLACACTSNGNNAPVGAGIHATGNDNRIEGNNVVRNDLGIDVDASGNLIIRNSASGNLTNYTISTGNSFGAIIAAGTNAIVVNGSTAGAVLGTTDPWANFSY